MRALVFAVVLSVASARISQVAGQGVARGEVSRAQFDAWMRDLSNWGRWGPNDQLGALNLVTSAKILAATRLVQLGRTVSMSRDIVLTALDHADASASRAPVLGGTVRNVFDIDTEYGYFWERYEIEFHGNALSHVDALCHFAHYGQVYNGLDFEAVASVEDGCTSLSVENLRNGVVTRGILVDLPGRAIRREDIEAWEAAKGIRISAGDALFLRTGRAVGERGGYHPSLIPFLKERDIAVIGADNAQEGGRVEGFGSPVHVFTLVALGVHVFDNLGLEELAQVANELDRWVFLFVAPPHVVPNGSGAALNPLAVF